MVKKSSIPPFYSLIKKNNTLLMLKDSHKGYLLEQGFEDLGIFLKKNLQKTLYLDGRTPHSSFPISYGKRMIIRNYSHGGLLRALTKVFFLFGARSFRELAFTEEVRSCGIPTIEPIGAIHRVTGFPPFYRA